MIHNPGQISPNSLFQRANVNVKSDKDVALSLLRLAMLALATGGLWVCSQTKLLTYLLSDSFRFVSTMNVVFIALDRFLSIKEPYAYRYINLYNAVIEYSSYALFRARRTKRNGIIVIVIMWMGAFSILCLAIRLIIVSEDQAVNEMNQINRTCEDDFMVSRRNTDNRLI